MTLHKDKLIAHDSDTLVLDVNANLLASLLKLEIVNDHVIEPNGVGKVVSRHIEPL